MRSRSALVGLYACPCRDLPKGPGQTPGCFRTAGVLAMSTLLVYRSCWDVSTLLDSVDHDSLGADRRLSRLSRGCPPPRLGPAKQRDDLSPQVSGHASSRVGLRPRQNSVVEEIGH